MEEKLLFEPGQKILFIGDSITDAGRREPNTPLGTGYVKQVRDLLVGRYRSLELRFINRGVSGDTTRHLLARWQADVIDEQPDWLSLKIGINDVWRSFDNYASEQAVSLPEYTKNLRRLIDRTRGETQARLILMTPYMIEPNRSDPMRAEMDRFGQVVKRLADEYGTVLVDTQAAFDVALQQTAPDDLAEDRIHPNAPGHEIIALAFLRAVGFSL